MLKTKTDEQKADNHETLESDITQRLNWSIGSKCYIYCDIQKEFMLAIINEIHFNEAGEWLRVEYNGTSRSVQRYSKFIKPFENNQDNTNTQKIKEDSDDIVTMIERNKGQLFDIKTDTNNSDECINRVLFVLSLYKKWINNNVSGKHMTDNHNLSMYELITEHLKSKQYDFYSFLADYRAVTNIKRDLLSNESEEKICTASECLIIDRNQQNPEKRLHLYYQFNNAQKNQNMDEINKNITTQQIIDSLHTYVFHTPYIDIDKIKLNIKSSNLEDLDFDHLCDDLYTTEICKMLEKEIHNSNRFRSRDKKVDIDG
eukprot:498385_1